MNRIAQIILFFFVSRSHYTTCATPGRIVGGFPDTIDNVPWLVSISRSGYHFCGGTLIAPNWVLTAAHCMTFIKDPNELLVRAGSSLKNQGGVQRKVQKIFINENFDRSLSFDYDVSLLLLMKPFEMGDKLSTIDLAEDGRLYTIGLQCMVSGWGKTQNRNQSELHLRSATVELVGLSDCQRMLLPSFVSDRMICAGGFNEDACQGDSGGPLICRGTITGIVSWGIGCGVRGKPGVYTYVPNVRDWIRENSGL